MLKSFQNNLAFSKFEKKQVINRPLMPPAGRIGFEVYADQIRVRKLVLEIEANIILFWRIYLFSKRKGFFILYKLKNTNV